MVQATALRAEHLPQVRVAEDALRVGGVTHRAEGQLLGFAGFYSWWVDRTADEDDPSRWKLTTTILTSDAVETLEGIHD